MIVSGRIRWAGHVTQIGEKRNAYRILMRKQEGRRPLLRPRCRWDDNIKIDLIEEGWEDMDWIHMVQDRNQWRHLVTAVINLRVP
jgi:hypothetical protein